LKLRLLTGLVIGAVALLLIFWTPPSVTIAAFVLIGFGAVYEFVPMVQPLLHTAPLRSLYAYVPLATLGGLYCLLSADAPTASLTAAFAAYGVLTVLVLIAAATTLLGGAAIADAVGSIGVLAFAIPYFTLPLLALCWLVAHDRPLLFLLIAIVSLGDSGAYFVGRKLGRHKLAPVVSPNKSWEGSAGGMFFSLLATAIFCQLRFGEIGAAWLGLAAATAALAQIGDLVQSMVKRAAGVKDSSNILPGHGGIYDRLDALIFAAPFFVAGLWALGLQPAP
jgi:phosphatidate cytidylyltransferase